jgi:hypothetical protein
MTESTETARTAAATAELGLPWQIRAARLAEGLFLPVGVFSLATIPLDDFGALVKVGVQVAVAVAAFVGLGRRRRWAWVAAIALAIVLIVQMVASVPELAHESMGSRDTLMIAVVIVGWAFLTQMVVLSFCLTLFYGRRWRTALH